MTKGDQNTIRVLFKEEIQPLSDKLDTICTAVQKHEQTLFGAQGRTGLYEDNQQMKKFRKNVIRIGGVAQAGIVGIVIGIKEIFFSK